MPECAGGASYRRGIVCLRMGRQGPIRTPAGDLGGLHFLTFGISMVKRFVTFMLEIS